MKIKLKMIIIGALILGFILIKVKHITLLQILLLGFALLQGYDSLNNFNLLLNRLGIVKALQIPFEILGITLILWGFFGSKIKKKLQIQDEVSRPRDRSGARMYTLKKVAKAFLLFSIGIFLIPYYICVGEVLGFIMQTYMYPETYLTVIEAQHNFVMIYTGFIVTVAEFYIVSTIFTIITNLLTTEDSY